MARSDIIETLTEIMCDLFDMDDLDYDDSITADDVEEWDSLSHVRFVVALEKEFDFRFTSSEIEGLKNLGEVVSAIEKHTAA